MSLKDEWECLIKDKNNIYIFGAGSVAKRIYLLLKDYNKNLFVKGFIVSNIDGNPESIDNIPVKEISTFNDMESYIFVSVSRVYHPEVYEYFENKGYKNIIETHKYFNLELSGNASNSTLFEDDLVDHLADTNLTSPELQIRDVIIDLFRKNSQAFGDNVFYQSYEKLGIKGLRPTRSRIEEYGLLNIISKKSKILDIGCNYGFIDLTLADKVDSIVGVEYNAKLVEIANTTASLLNIQNVFFECNDYKEWQRNCNDKYDVIFSFAVHVWLNISPEMYAIQLYNMLNYKGVLFFESQDIEHDIRFDDFCDAFTSIGFNIVRKSVIKDDGKTNRKYVVFSK